MRSDESVIESVFAGDRVSGVQDQAVCETAGESAAENKTEILEIGRVSERGKVLLEAVTAGPKSAGKTSTSSEAKP